MGKARLLAGGERDGAEAIGLDDASSLFTNVKEGT
jgi:hypothetical protein